MPQSDGRADLPIEYAPGLVLPPETTAILAEMFAGYGRLLVSEELTGGFSGSRVVIVRPLRHDGIPELPAVVKLGPTPLIEQEWLAYQAHIQNQLPGVAEIRGAPVLPPNGQWAGLRYPLVGSGAFAVESLQRYYGHASPADLAYILNNRLFKQLRLLWRFNFAAPAFSLGASYDRLLPVNFQLEPASPPADTLVRSLAAGERPNWSVQPGQYLALSGFVVERIETEVRTATLNWPVSGERPASFRVHVRPLPEPMPWQVGDMVQELQGRVTSTRLEVLRGIALEGLGYDFDLDGEMVVLPGCRPLPNPLLRLSQILAATPTVRIGTVHGDLNPENILVDPETREVHLIDFANARRDHVLHDLLRLEAGIITRLLPKSLDAASPGPQVLLRLYEQLHAGTAGNNRAELAKTTAALLSVRQTARDFLFDPDDWREYADGLTLYLLGASKYHNLTPLAKQLAFYGAAIAQELRNAALPTRADFTGAGPAPATAPAKRPFPRPRRSFPGPAASPELFRQNNVADPAAPPPRSLLSPSQPAGQPTSNSGRLAWWLPALLITAILLVLAGNLLADRSQTATPEATNVTITDTPPVTEAVAAVEPTSTVAPLTTITSEPTAPCPQQVGAESPLPFHPAGEPITVVILFDTTTTMRGNRLLCAIAAAKLFIERLEPADQLYLFNFGTALFPVQSGPAGEVSEAAQARLDNFFAEGQMGPDEAVCQMEEALAEEDQRATAVLLLTTEDHEAKRSDREVGRCLAAVPELQFFAAVYGETAGRWAEMATAHDGEAFAVTEESISVTLAQIRWQP